MGAPVKAGALPKVATPHVLTPPESGFFLYFDDGGYQRMQRLWYSSLKAARAQATRMKLARPVILNNMGDLQ